MPSAIGSIWVELGVDAVKLNRGMDEAEVRVKRGANEIARSLRGMSGVFGEMSEVCGQFGSVVGQMIGSAGKAISEFGGVAAKSLGGAGIALAGAGGAAVAAGAAVISLAVSSAETIEQVDRLSRETGLSRQEIIGWGAVAKVTGGSMESFTVGMRRLEVAMSGIGPRGNEARAVLRDLGVTARDPQEALLEIADAFQKIPDGARKSASAIAIFGRQGTEMVPALDRGREEIEKILNMANEFGPTIDDKAVQSVDRFKEATTKLSLEWESVKVSMSGVLEVLTKLMDKNSFWYDLGAHKVGDMLGTGSPTEGLNPHPGRPSIGDIFNSLDRKQQGELDREQLANAQRLFEISKARGPAELALADAEARIAQDVKDATSDSYARAAALEKELPALQKAADLERQARQDAERRASAHADAMARIGQSISGYLPKPNFGGLPQKPSLLDQAPNVGGPDLTFPGMGIVDKLPANLASVQTAMSDFFGTGIEKDIETLNDFKKSLSELFSKGAIDAPAFAAAMNQIQLALQHAQFQQAQQVFHDLIDDLKNTNTISAQFKSFGLSLEMTSLQIKQGFADLAKNGLDNLESSMANFITTGRGGFIATLKQMEQALVKLGLQFVISAAMKKLFDSVGQSAQTTGLSASQAVRQSAIGQSAAEAATSAAWGGPGAAIAAAVETLGALEGITALANGGDMIPGHAYLVGEKHPEIMVAGTSGRVYNSPGKVPVDGASGGSSGDIHIHHTVQAIDTRTEQEMLLRNSDIITEAVIRGMRDRNVNPREFGS